MLRRSAHARGGFVDTCQHHGAGGHVGGGAGDVRKRVEHIVDRCTQALCATLEDRFELAQLVGARGVCRLGRSGYRGLPRQVLAEITLYGLNGDALAHIAVAGVLSWHCRQHHFLTRVTGHIDVGNIVAGSLQRSLVGLQCPGSDVE